MKVVIDTNVIVSGLLQTYSPPGEIIDRLTTHELIPCVDMRIMAEYEEVLGRPKFKIKKEKINFLLDLIQSDGQFCVGSPLPAHLPHRADEAFLEVALAGDAACLITGNIVHFPPECRGGIKVVTPREFVEIWRKQGIH